MRVGIDFRFSISDLPFAVMTNGRHVPHRHNRIAHGRSGTVCRFQKVCGGEAETRNKHGLPETPEALLDRSGIDINAYIYTLDHSVVGTLNYIIFMSIIIVVYICIYSILCA